MKRIVFGFLILIGIGCSFLFYSWRQATQLPEWYTNQSKNTQNNLDLTDSSELLAVQTRLQSKIDEKIAQSLATSSDSLPVANTSSPDNSFSPPQQISNNKNVEIELSNQEFNELLVTKIAKYQEQSKLISATSGIQTTIKDGVLESGTLVNLANLPRNQLSPSETKAVDKVLEILPGLENKEIYLGLTGKPKIENGQLLLDDNTQVKLGNLSFSISEISQRLGIPQETLQQKLRLSLQTGRLNVSDGTLTGDKVLLRGSVE